MDPSTLNSLVEWERKLLQLTLETFNTQKGFLECNTTVGINYSKASNSAAVAVDVVVVLGEKRPCLGTDEEELVQHFLFCVETNKISVQ